MTIKFIMQKEAQHESRLWQIVLNTTNTTNAINTRKNELFQWSISKDKSQLISCSDN